MERQTTLVAIDVSNIFYPISREGWLIDWERFKEHLQKDYDVQMLLFYEGIMSKGVYFNRNPRGILQDFNLSKKRKKKFFTRLREMGYRVRSKPVTRVYDNTSGTVRHKCNFDVEITVDAIQFKALYKTFILVSGDGDFIALIKYLKLLGKEVVVISHPGHLNQNLKRMANRSISLRRLRKEIEKTKPRFPRASSL